MATNYPSAIDSFTNPQGTNTLDSPDHADQHSSANDAIEAIEAVIGTTAGTSVLKDFSAGEFPVRQEGGTITQTLTGGTINATTLGTPTVTGGSFASPTTTGTDSGTATLTNKTLTSPVINNATFTGGGALLSKVYEFTRDMTAASGDVAITNIGFQPSSIIFYSAINGSNGYYISFVDSTKAGKGMITVDGTSKYNGEEVAINYHTTINTDHQKAVIKSFDSDGFTLTWTKTGSPTGTLTIICLCFR